MLLYLARATQVIDSEVRDPRSYLDNVGTLQASIDEAKRALGIALMRKARSMNSGTKEFDIHWDKPLKARCVVPSFAANGNKGHWMEAAIGQINEMRVCRSASTPAAEGRPITSRMRNERSVAGVVSIYVARW